MQPLYRGLSLLISAGFMLMLLAPLAGWLNGIEPQVAVEENRQAARFPAFGRDNSSLGRFPARFGAWFDDHLSLRPLLVEYYGWLTRDLLNSHNTVLAGQDDWLFLLREPRRTGAAPPIVSDHCGRNPFSPEALDGWVQALVRNRTLVEAQGRHYVFMPVPNKQTVYHRHFPERIRCRPGPTRLDQLVEALKQQPDFPILDLRDAFLANDGQRLWYRTDTHWNGVGASLALDTLLAHLNGRMQLSLTNAVTTDRFRLARHKTRGWGLAVMSGLGNRFIEREPQIVAKYPLNDEIDHSFTQRTRDPRRQPQVFQQPDDALPDILVLHDSFFNLRIKRLLADSFHRSTFVWHRGRPQLEDERSLIESVQPNIVLHEMVERNLLHDHPLR